MTKEQANSLIERLLASSNYFGASLMKDTSQDVKDFVAGACPIMLTDVLDKIKNFHTEPEKAPEHIGCLMDTDKACCDLMRLWWNLGFTRSLQDILNEAEWEDVSICTSCHMRVVNGLTLIKSGCPHTGLEDQTWFRGHSSQENLFQYLSSLFPET